MFRERACCVFVRNLNGNCKIHLEQHIIIYLYVVQTTNVCIDCTATFSFFSMLWAYQFSEFPIFTINNHPNMVWYIINCSKTAQYNRYTYFPSKHSSYWWFDCFCILYIRGESLKYSGETKNTHSKYPSTISHTKMSNAKICSVYNMCLLNKKWSIMEHRLQCLTET